MRRQRPRRRDSKWWTAFSGVCTSCGRGRLLIGYNGVLHHVTYEQHVRAYHGDLDDPDNAMTLCDDCHQRHHHTSWRLQARLLTHENVRFMVAVLGSVERAAIYLRRYYDVEGR